MVEFRVIHYDFKAVPPLNELLTSGHFVKPRVSLCLRVLLDKTKNPFNFIAHFFIKAKLICLLLVEVTLRSLFNQVRVDNTSLDAASNGPRVIVLV